MEKIKFLVKNGLYLVALSELAKQSEAQGAKWLLECNLGVNHPEYETWLKAVKNLLNEKIQ
jgi:hypothetical protein